LFGNCLPLKLITIDRIDRQLWEIDLGLSVGFQWSRLGKELWEIDLGLSVGFQWSRLGKEIIQNFDGICICKI